jgi:hypothetical protein
MQEPQPNGRSLLLLGLLLPRLPNYVPPFRNRAVWNISEMTHENDVQNGTSTCKSEREYVRECFERFT